MKDKILLKDKDGAVNPEEYELRKRIVNSLPPDMHHRFMHADKAWWDRKNGKLVTDKGAILD